MVRYTRPGAGVRASSCAAELRNSSPAAAPDLASSYSVPGAGAGARDCKGISSGIVRGSLDVEPLN